LNSNVTAVDKPSSLQHTPSARDPLPYTIITYVPPKQGEAVANNMMECNHLPTLDGMLAL
jgi:hypothetical protein